MATKTDQDVVNRALRNMSIIAAGDTADGDTYGDALDAYTVFHEWLMGENKRLYRSSKGRWAKDAVPAEVWTNVAAMLARELLAEFSVSPRVEARIERTAERAEARLNKYLARPIQQHERLPKGLSGRYAANSYYGSRRSW